MKTVMAFGTFDIFHKGHESYLKQAKKLGDYLIVVVARDKTVIEIKKQRATNSERERAKKLKSEKIAEKVILGDRLDKYKVLKKYKPRIIVLGYDQEVNILELRGKIKKLKLNTKIIRAKSFRPKIYKSSKIKDKK